MASHSSASVRERSPHANQTIKTATVANALKRRAQTIVNDKSIDAQIRMIVRYGLETNDPWLAELVRRADEGEAIVDAIDFSQEPPISEDDSGQEKIETLAEIICRDGDEPGRKSAALLVLMATLEDSKHPKALTNNVKHLAFRRCGDLNLCRMVEAQVAVLEGELLAGNSLTS